MPRGMEANIEPNIEELFIKSLGGNKEHSLCPRLTINPFKYHPRVPVNF